MLCVYSLITFKEKITSMRQRVQSLPCACAFVALFGCVLAQWLYASLRADKQHMHTHKAVAGELKRKSHSLFEGNQTKSQDN